MLPGVPQVGANPIFYDRPCQLLEAICQAHGPPVSPPRAARLAPGRASSSSYRPRADTEPASHFTDAEEMSDLEFNSVYPRKSQGVYHAGLREPVWRALAPRGLLVQLRTSKMALGKLTSLTVLRNAEPGRSVTLSVMAIRRPSNLR